MKSKNPIIHNSSPERRRRAGITPLLILIFLFLFSCRERVVPPDNGSHYTPTIELTKEDVGVTDAFIRLKFLDTLSAAPKQFSLTRDGQTILSALCSPLDTLILDEGLLPKRQYTYKAYRFSNSIPTDSSTPLILTTMDTTSHEYTWQSWTFGEHSSSTLRDVAIINDTCIWAVGEIYLRDSLGHIDPQAYNVARWDGEKWNLIRVMFPICGTSGTAPFPARAVFAFSANNVWVTSAGTIARWNGSSFSTMCIPSDLLVGAINKVWAGSPNNVYIVGNLGMILNYIGTWRRLELPSMTGQSGTELDILDIWGKSTDYILCIASKRGTQIPSKIIRIKNTHIDTVNWQPQKLLNSVWFKDDRRIYTAGSGVYFYKNGIWRIQSDVPTLYSFSIRGIELNDIWTVGGYGLCAHYNGVSWKSYAEVRMSSGNYYSLSVKSKIIVAVGFENNKAKIIIGGKL